MQITFNLPDQDPDSTFYALYCALRMYADLKKSQAAMTGYISDAFLATNNMLLELYRQNPDLYQESEREYEEIYKGRVKYSKLIVDCDNAQMPFTTGAEDIARERYEQINKHGFTGESDGRYSNGELITAAMYAINPGMFAVWPWPDTHFRDNLFIKPITGKLSVAGAFLAAEIDRLKRIECSDDGRG